MMFVTLQESSLKKLPECEQEEFERLEDLTIEQKLGWLNSIKLDKPFEGRMEFLKLTGKASCRPRSQPGHSCRNSVPQPA